MPAAAVWEPGPSPARPGTTPTVRRLEVDVRTEQLPASRVALGNEDAAVRRARRGRGESAQAYLVGGLFGLSVVLGAWYAAPEEPSTPAPAVQSEGAAVSVR